MSDLRLFTHQPSQPLRRYVREMIWARSNHPRTQFLLPETTLTLALRQSGQASLHNQTLPHALVSGLQQQTRIIQHEADSFLLIVRFTEAGSPAVLHDRVDLLYNLTLALDEILPRAEIDSIQNVLADTPNVDQQFRAVERFLLRRIQQKPAISPQIESAAQLIRNSDGRASVTALARRAGMSQSALERHFRAAVGASPKTLSRLARLQHVCRLWDAGKSLTEITFDAGYFDQPHMVRDFRLFTGKAPEEFFRGSFRRNLPTFYK